MKINILLFWFSESWGEGRTFQKVAEQLSQMQEVKRVICIFPPNPVREDEYAWPLKTKRITDKLIVLSQHKRVVPTSSRPFRLRVWINTCFKENALLSYLRTYGFRKDNTVLWLFPPHPHIYEIIRIIPHNLLVAHIVDNFTKLEEDKWLCDHATEQYPKLQRNADVVITGSEYNYRLFSLNRKHCYLFENAVDEDFLGEPSSQPHLTGALPRLGYVGTISQRTDTRLLAYTARSRPEWSFLIAGRQEISLNDFGLLNLPNVRYLGLIPYRELPKFLQSLDVCLMPHINTDFAKSMSPLKLYQYLASGRPIVSTNTEGLQKLKEYLRIGETYEDFIHCIECALKEETIEMSRRRIEAARRETWNKRVNDMFAVVKERFMEMR